MDRHEMTRTDPGYATSDSFIGKYPSYGEQIVVVIVGGGDHDQDWARKTLLS